jgi:Na+-translocating ferredoxin:NAD+ oxidoreductase subunit B
MISLYILIVLAGLGLAFGLLLAFANKKLVVEINPLIHEVDEVLPKGQCGACGYAGCIGYAEAVVTNPDVPTNLCIPGKEETARKVAEITGKKAAVVDQRIASIKCAGSYQKAIRTYEYKGVDDCISAHMLQGGNKGCRYGCLGYGTCVAGCLFDAMQMSPEGLPVVNPEKCTGCGKCLTLCPRDVISLVPPQLMVRVNCNSKEKGAISRKFCSVSCIACQLCAKACPYNAITVENNLASVNNSICIEKCNDPVCLVKCPTKAIRQAVLGVVPGEEGV